MSMDLILQVIIWLIVAGFIYWAFKLLLGIMPIDDWFKQIISVLVLILVAALVLFKVIIPVLQAVAHISINIH
jgi:hypothetical protein